MVKLKDVQMHRIETVPEHILQEMTELAGILLTEWQEMSRDTQSNISMGAWNFAHAVLLVEYLDEQFVHKGAKMSALSLIKNVEMLMLHKRIPFIALGSE